MKINISQKWGMNYKRCSILHTQHGIQKKTLLPGRLLFDGRLIKNPITSPLEYPSLETRKKIDVSNRKKGQCLHYPSVSNIIYNNSENYIPNWTYLLFWYSGHYQRFNVRFEHYLHYRIYSINRPERLLNFWTLRVGAYWRLGAY